MSGKTDRELQRYFDGELSPRRARKVHDRLQSCEVDRQQLARLKSMRVLLQETVAHDVGQADLDGLWQGVEAGLARARPLTWREQLAGWMRRHRVAAATTTAVAAAAVVLLILVSLFSRGVRNDCTIETLEVGPDAVSTIFTIDDPEGQGETTVIWVNDDLSQGGMR